MINKNTKSIFSKDKYKILLLIFIFISNLFSAWDFFNQDKGFNLQYINSLDSSKNIIYIGTPTGIFTFNNDNTLNSLAIRLPTTYIEYLMVVDNELWIATPKGLIRYDLIRKITTLFTEQEGLSSIDISCLAYDENYVYIGTKKWGINVYDRNKKVINKKKITTIDGLPSNKVYRILTSPSYVFAATDLGIAWKGKYDSSWMVPDEESKIEPLRVRGLAFMDQDLFIGTEGDGIYEFNLDTLTSKKHTYTSGEIPDDNIFDLKADGRQLWIATFSGGALYDKGTGKWEFLANFTSDQNEKTLLESSMNSIIIKRNYVMFGTDGNGLYQYNKNIPELTISPVMLFTNNLDVGAYVVNIIGSVRSDRGIKSIKVSYKDAEVQKPFDKGIIQLPIKQNGYYQESLAQINFNANAEIKNSTVKSRLWKFAVTLSVEDNQGNNNTATAMFLYDNQKPELTFLRLPEYTLNKTLPLRGKYNDLTLHTIDIFPKELPDKKLPVTLNTLFKTFYTEIPLREGLNNYTCRAIDSCGNIKTEYITITRDTVPPRILTNSRFKKVNLVPSELVPLRISFEEDAIDKDRIYLIKGDKRIKAKNIDTIEKVISFALVATSEVQYYTLVVHDLAGNKTEYQFSIAKDEGETPSIILDNNDKDNYTVATNKITLTGKIISRYPVTLWGLDTKDVRVKADYNQVTKEFNINYYVYKGKNLLRVIAKNDKNVESKRLISVDYATETQVVEKKEIKKIEEPKIVKVMDQDAASELLRTRTSLQELEIEITRLKKQNEVLAASKTKTVQVNTGEVKKEIVYKEPRILEDEPGLFVVPFDPGKGDSLHSISFKYYESDQYIEIITFLNTYITEHKIKASKKIVVPNKKMINLLTLRMNDTDFLDLICIIAYGLYTNSDSSSASMITSLRSLRTPILNSVEMQKKSFSVISFSSHKKGVNLQDYNLKGRQSNKIDLILKGNTANVKIY